MHSTACGIPHRANTQNNNPIDHRSQFDATTKITQRLSIA